MAHGCANDNLCTYFMLAIHAGSPQENIRGYGLSPAVYTTRMVTDFVSTETARNMGVLTADHWAGTRAPRSQVHQYSNLGRTL
jgi:hypothetical protein